MLRSVCGSYSLDMPTHNARLPSSHSLQIGVELNKGPLHRGIIRDCTNPIDMLIEKVVLGEGPPCVPGAQFKLGGTAYGYV